MTRQHIGSRSLHIALVLAGWACVGLLPIVGFAHLDPFWLLLGPGLGVGLGLGVAARATPDQALHRHAVLIVAGGLAELTIWMLILYAHGSRIFLGS